MLEQFSCYISSMCGLTACMITRAEDDWREKAPCELQHCGVYWSACTDTRHNTMGEVNFR